MNYQDQLKIYKKAKRIVASDLEWKDKYDMIFSDEISKNFKLDYYDPDTSYQEDVEAFMCALDEYMKKQEIVNGSFLDSFDKPSFEDLQKVGNIHEDILQLIHSTNIHEDIIDSLLEPFENLLKHNGVNLQETDY